MRCENCGYDSNILTKAGEMWDHSTAPKKSWLKRNSSFFSTAFIWMCWLVLFVTLGAVGSCFDQQVVDHNRAIACANGEEYFLSPLSKTPVYEKC